MVDLKSNAYVHNDHWHVPQQLDLMAVPIMGHALNTGPTRMVHRFRKPSHIDPTVRFFPAKLDRDIFTIPCGVIKHGWKIL